MRLEFDAAKEKEDVKHLSFLFNYLLKLDDIRATHGWQTADRYHWELLTTHAAGGRGCFDGFYFHHEETLQLAIQETKNGRSAGKIRLKFCPHHGYCAHNEKDCKVIQQDPSKASTRAPNFRASK